MVFMDILKIEKAAQDAFNQIWTQHTTVQKYPINSVMELINPILACQLQGVAVNLCYELGCFGQGADKFEVAGGLDRQNKKILISEKFPIASQRFTMAHELGHWILHPDNIMHRDRPIAGLDQKSHTKPIKEREADYFAACFLMPRNTVIAQFKNRFGDQLPFRFDESSSFWLGHDDPQSLIYSDQKSLDRELALATCTHYRMNSFKSLANFFGVSNQTMAIRLSELQLIRWP
jgi:Zn-dependent peptidase ImmA (M78 family)